MLFVHLANLLTAQGPSVDLSPFVGFLQTGGPWSLLALALWAVKFMHDKRELDRIKHDDERDKHDADKQRLNDRLISMAEEQNKVLEKATHNQALLLEAIAQGQPRAKHPKLSAHTEET